MTLTGQGGAGGPGSPGRRPQGGTPPSEQGSRLRLVGAGVTLLAVVVGAAVLASVCSRPSRPLSARVGSPGPSPTPSELPDLTPVVAPSAATTGPSCPTTGQLVTDATSLAQALKTASPGAVIRLAAGRYAGEFVATASGTQTAPITLCGSRDAVIDGGNVKSGYGLHLDGASWWKLIGFTVQDAQKGVVTDHASHVLISGLYVHEIGDEGVHLRSASSDDTVENVLVRNTGRLNTKFGEGIYIGSAHSNWCRYSACGPDQSDRDVIRNNDISETTAENIDIKEGTTGGTVSGNKLSGAGMVESAATAWINAKGNGWTITDNVGEQSIRDGFQVHEVYPGWGQQNVFRGNQANVNGPGFGFYVQHVSLGTVLSCDNTATGAGSGMSNIRCA